MLDKGISSFLRSLRVNNGMRNWTHCRMPKQAYVDDLLAESFACFEQGLCDDEDNDTKAACQMYERGLDIVKLAEKQKECKSSEQYKNVLKTQKKVQERLKILKNPKKSKGDKKDSKDSSTEKDNLKNELREQLQSADFPEAELIFFIPNGVQLFMIEDDDTTVPTYPSPLEIFRLNNQAGSSTTPNADAFMKVGPWMYPLKAGSIPILKNEFGAYVMPNPTPDHPNMFVGILLPADLATGVENEFLTILKQYAVVHDQVVSEVLSTEEQRRLSHKIAELLIKGSEHIAWGVSYAAERTSGVVTDHSMRLRSSITKNEVPMNVNPLIRTGVYCVHGGSKVVAKCTRYLLDKIGDMGVAVGRGLASGAEKTFGGGKTGGVVSGTLTVLAGGIAGASTVWISLEDASKTLCKSIANETVETVRHKYGDEASVTAHRALYATGHTTLAAFQLYDLGPRAIAGRAARKAGVQFVTGLHKERSVSSLDSKSEKESLKEKEETSVKKKKTI